MLMENTSQASRHFPVGVVFRVSTLFVCSAKCCYHASYGSNEASLFVLIDGFHCHTTKKYIWNYSVDKVRKL